MLAAICHGIKWKDRLDLCDCVYLFSITSCRGCYLPQWPAFSFFKFFFFFSFEKLNCTALQREGGRERADGGMRKLGSKGKTSDTKTMTVLSALHLDRGV